jgi:hypothetical protein
MQIAKAYHLAYKVFRLRDQLEKVYEELGENGDLGQGHRLTEKKFQAVLFRVEELGWYINDVEGNERGTP